jgi:hypothetical protein
VPEYWTHKALSATDYMWKIQTPQLQLSGGGQTMACKCQVPPNSYPTHTIRLCFVW